VSGDFWLGFAGGATAIAFVTAALFVWWLTGLVRK
jgi:hypothetical protein